jgi:hypothetical protein
MHQSIAADTAASTAKVLRNYFHRVILPGRGKTDLDRRVWFPRIHDYGLNRLHIHELVFDLPGRLQAKFLRFFRATGQGGSASPKTMGK